MSDAYRFLARQGAINFGLLRGDPRVPLPRQVAEQLAPQQGAADALPDGPSDLAVAEKLFDVMAAADMNVRLGCCWGVQLLVCWRLPAAGRRQPVRLAWVPPPRSCLRPCGAADDGEDAAAAHGGGPGVRPDKPQVADPTMGEQRENRCVSAQQRVPAQRASVRIGGRLLNSSGEPLARPAV